MLILLPNLNVSKIPYSCHAAENQHERKPIDVGRSVTNRLCEKKLLFKSSRPTTNLPTYINDSSYTSDSSESSDSSDSNDKKMCDEIKCVMKKKL